jgi:serine/arginine repetitive matrix protein 2
MRASFERERAEWKAKAARSLQSSKLTRSLGRSRSQSTGRTRAQLKDAGGLEFLATKTLLGNQLAAPTVHTSTSSDGTQTQHTRSSHARTTSSGGHSRAGSKSKSALRAATGLCISDDKMSPKEELFARHDGEGKAVRVEASPPKLDARILPSPPVISDSSVGIAVSSPPPSTEQDATQSSGPIYVPDHPYAQSGGHSTPRRSHTRSSSDYAGAHPSAVSVSASATVLASDMSARHRLPPQLVPHPYASALAYPNATSTQYSTVPPPSPPKGPHETAFEHAPPQPKATAPNPPRRSPPLSNIDDASRAAPHAYASNSRLSGAPLILADALSFGLERRFSADSGLGDSESHQEAPSNPAQLPSSLPSFALATVRERSRPNLAHRRALLPLQSYQAAASSPAEALNPPIFTASLLTYSLNSGQASLAEEHHSASRSSSPQQSPPPLSRIEDLDRYRDLFYQPIASGSGRTSSVEHHRAMSRDPGSLAGLAVSSASSVSGASDLIAFRRQLDSELEAMQDVSHLDRVGTLPDRPPRRMWGLRYGGMRGGDGMGSRTDPNVVLSTSDSEAGTTTLPLRLHRSLGHPSDASLTVHIPQDVESRRSSVLDRSEIEDADHDGTYDLSLVAF